ncbi:ribosomal protein L6 [Oratosquilla oratoria]|uniref:ribosomal protein L6 n=1 Tax=Oratosquilla oratoria TaxID=337810 RepID=UPI003F7657E9
MPAAAKKPSRPRNYALSSGVYRFGRGKVYHKKALYKFIKKGQTKKRPERLPARMVEKPIGGEKNGGKRHVRVKKLPAYYATELGIKKRPSKNTYSKHKRSLRSTITPGTVCILLAGVHKGKKVVFLKQLESGLCVVTGPFKINRCPLRRVNQIYLIATATKLDLSDIALPKTLNDNYFKRVKSSRAKKEEGDIFDQKKEKYVPSEQRKKDQVEVDKQVLDAIRKREDKKTFFGYLGTMFGLRNGQYPHAMKF